MKKKKRSKKGFDLKAFAFIALVILTGLGIAFCLIYAVNGFWTGFAVCLGITVVLFLIVCPLGYYGDIFECPKCGNKFKVNPYKVFFTNGFLQIFDFDGTPMKYAKLKCPHCNTKEWCKWERKKK